LLSNGRNYGTVLNLNGYTLEIGKGGVTVCDWMNPKIAGQGRLTSSQYYLNIYMQAETKTDFVFCIDAVISDHANHRVGLRVLGDFNKQSGIVLGGTGSNTFTGDLEISGSDKYVALNKLNGATAIQGNIYLNDNTILSLWQSNQISDSSSLKVKKAFVFFGGWEWDIEEKLGQMIIEQEGALIFGHELSASARKALFLDDLLIAPDSFLIVRGWKAGRDWLLVRKTSKNLSDALKKIRFEGYDPNAVHLEEYNKDYWAISGTPEPSTYGVTFTSGILGFAFCQRRRTPHKSRRYA